MTSKDRANRARWSRHQQAAASAAFAAELQSVAAERATSLAGLRQFETMLRDVPHMASTLAAVRVEIARLERV